MSQVGQKGTTLQYRDSIGYRSGTGGLGAVTFGTENFLVSVPVSIPRRLKMLDLVKDFIIKSRSQFHKTKSQSLGLGLDLTRPIIKVSVSVSFLRPQNTGLAHH